MHSKQEGERGNNLVSDILLNANISHNVPALKTRERDPAAGRIIILVVQSKLSKCEDNTVAWITSPTTYIQLTFTCQVEELAIKVIINVFWRKQV